MSVDSFERYVQPDLKIVRVGRMRLLQVRELEKWLERSAARVLVKPRIRVRGLGPQAEKFSWTLGSRP